MTSVSLVVALTVDVTFMVCLVAPSSADRPVALVFPVRYDFNLKTRKLTSQHQANLRNHIAHAGLVDEGDTPEQWAKSDAIRGYVLGTMRETAKAAGLAKGEMIRDVILTEHEW